MLAELACLFPKGLKHKVAERQTHRHQLPFRFVPDETKESEERDKHLCKEILVDLTTKSTMKVVPHTFTNVENFLLYQIQHKYILSHQEAMSRWTNLDLVLNDAEVKVTALLANSEEETDKKKNIE